MAKKLRVVVGITGGIAAYKAVSIVREFVVAGHHVDVIATHSAFNFVGQATLEAISRNNVHTSLYDDVASVRHVELGKNADVIVIAPATAHTLAQLAHGLAPDLLGTTVLASSCPVVVAPAMHTEMWDHPATQENIDILRARGVNIIGPVSGQLTGDDVGLGKMAEPENIVSFVLGLFTHTNDLAGHKILVTAGGTREPLDPVRFIGNRSSGKQALAIVENALSRGAEVTVVAAHCDVSFPPQAQVKHVSTAEQMLTETLELFPAMSSVFMVAAVSDYRPEFVDTKKIKKSETKKDFTLTLVENPDILATLSHLKKPDQIVVGFAAETEANKDVRIQIGRNKIRNKQSDYLVVNHVSWSEGFESDNNDVDILSQYDDKIVHIAGSKSIVATALLDHLLHTSFQKDKGKPR